MPPQSWQVTAASVSGRSHERTGQPCQDAHAWRVVSDRVLVVAVADGAGSAALAEVGAKLAADTSVGYLSARLDEDQAGTGTPAWGEAATNQQTWYRTLLEQAFEGALSALVQEADAQKTPVKSLATTLLIAVATPDGVVAGQVGDGAVVAQADGHWVAVTRPLLGEYLNESVFLTSAGALQKIQIQSRPGPIHRLALFSDGLQMLALELPALEPHAQFFAPLFEWVISDTLEQEHATPTSSSGARLATFLQSPRLRERTDDDLTLVMAVVRSAP